MPFVGGQPPGRRSNLRMPFFVPDASIADGGICSARKPSKGEDARCHAPGSPLRSIRCRARTRRKKPLNRKIFPRAQTLYVALDNSLGTRHRNFQRSCGGRKALRKNSLGGLVTLPGHFSFQSMAKGRASLGLRGASRHRVAKGNWSRSGARLFLCMAGRAGRCCGCGKRRKSLSKSAISRY